jgi:2-amino-4-hydroxy-6-hydroxymethyldihydropteridine diphosphokinase
MNTALHTRSFIALGSNLVNPTDQVKTAIVDLQQLPNTQFIRASSLYPTKPMGPQDQPDFINAVVELTTALTAYELFDHLMLIEKQHGRLRDGMRWGPRILDLDLLLYGDLILDSVNLVLPHPGMKTREFVLRPLYEIAPELCLPTGEKVVDLLSF